VCGKSSRLARTDELIQALRQEFIGSFSRETTIIARTSKWKLPQETFVDRSLYYFYAQEDQRAEDDQRANYAGLTAGEFRRCVYRWLDCADRRLTAFAVELCEVGYDIESIERQLEEICLLVTNAIAPDWLLCVGGDRETMLKLMGEVLEGINEKALNRAKICCAKRDQDLVRQNRQPAAASRLQSSVREAMKKHPGFSYREICGEVDARRENAGGTPVPPKCKRHNHETLVESIDCGHCRNYMKSFLSRERKPLVLPKPPRSQFPQKTKVAKLSKVRN